MTTQLVPRRAPGTRLIDVAPLVALSLRLRDGAPDEADVSQAATWLNYLTLTTDWLDSRLASLADRVLPAGGVRVEERGWQRRDGSVTASAGLRWSGPTHRRYVTTWEDGRRHEEPWVPITPA